MWRVGVDRLSGTTAVSLGNLNVPERQKILRLLVKEVLVGRDTITIRHSIRISTSGPDPNLDPRPPHQPQQQSTSEAGSHYLLRSDSNHPALRNALFPSHLPHPLEQMHDLILPYPSRHLL